MSPPFFSNNENLALWARSEMTGFAVIKYHGVVEYWNTGFGGMRSIFYR
jgi:hypothetical protein